MIAVIDYGLGNLYSVKRALIKVKVEFILADKPEDLDKADKLILPGVGAFGDGMEGLKSRNLVESIKLNAERKPILGICLGMQLFMEAGYEFGRHEGLGLIKGRVEKIRTEEKLPQIGWNQIKEQKNSLLLKGVSNKDFFYFVHSFVVRPTNKAVIAATTDYGQDEFCSVIEESNIYGTQFHPEKSSDEGIKIYQNFINIKN
jgi:imidazole glycerol-phosphate synthase subunit HisH